MNSTYLLGAAAVVTAVLLYFILGGGESTIADSERMVREFNAKLPTMVDGRTRLDSIELRNKTIIYKHTMIDFAAADLPRAQMEMLLGPQLRKASCTASMMQPLWKEGYTARYVYYGKDQRKITEIEVNRSDCGMSAQSLGDD